MLGKLIKALFGHAEILLRDFLLNSVGGGIGAQDGCVALFI